MKRFLNAAKRMRKIEKNKREGKKTVQIFERQELTKFLQNLSKEKKALYKVLRSKNVFILRGKAGKLKW